VNSLAESIIILSQNLVQGKVDSEQEITFADTLPLLINRFGYSSNQTQDLLSALLTNGKVRVHYKEIWQRLSLKDPKNQMPPAAAENLVNEMLNEGTPGLKRISLSQAPSAEFTLCISIKKQKAWKDLVVEDKINGYFEDSDGKKITILAKITEIAATEDYHRAFGNELPWLVANPESTKVGSSNYYYLLSDT